MPRDNYIPKRSDIFYYIEVWDKQELRDSKISNIMNTKIFPTQYVNGTSKSIHKTEVKYAALFWKKKVSATYRISQFERRLCYSNLIFIIREMDRKEFIKTIPDEVKLKSTDLLYWNINRSLKAKELNYRNKLKKLYETSKKNNRLV